MCTADTLHAYLRSLEGAGSPHSCVCNKTAHIVQKLKKKKIKKIKAQALFCPLQASLQAPGSKHAYSARPEEQDQKASLSQRQEETAVRIAVGPKVV